MHFATSGVYFTELGYIDMPVDLPPLDVMAGLYTTQVNYKTYEQPALLVRLNTTDIDELCETFDPVSPSGLIGACNSVLQVLE